MRSFVRVALVGLVGALAPLLVAASAEARDPAAATHATPAEAAAAPPPVQEPQLLAQWLKNSPEVASWRTQVGAARFDAVTAGLWANPELLVLGNFLLDGSPPDGVYNYQAQLTVPLPIFGQVSSRVEAAHRATSVAEMNVVQTVWARAAEIEAAMVARAFADARIAMLERNLEELERIRGIVSTRAGAGANSEYDVLRVDAAAGTLRASIANARVERDRAESSVLALVADPELTSANVTRDGLASFRGPEDLDALVALALNRRPDLELARRASRYAEANATRYRKDAIPTPSLVVGGYLSEKQYGFQVTGGVSIPLPISDRNQGQIGRAVQEEQGQRFLAQALETRIRAEVTGSWKARKNARTALAQYRDGSIASATALLKRAEVTYQAGRFSITELFDAYQTMWDARSQELDIERQGADAEADLERAAVLLPVVAPEPR